jgi:hypothetical protein
MRGTKAKRLRRQAVKLVFHTALAADANGKTLRYQQGTFRRIYQDLKTGRIYQ